jgi:hypothetical protein
VAIALDRFIHHVDQSIQLPGDFEDRLRVIALDARLSGARESLRFPLCE